MHLPVGVSNFKDLIKNKDPQQKGYLYIDKTNFIKEIIYDLTPVIVLTRPRRFGKTLNLSMLHYFFAAEVEGESTKGLFNELDIFKDSACMNHQGKYPVIFISFKDVKQSNFEFCLEKIKNVIADTYRSYRKELSAKNIAPDDQIYIELILTGKSDRVALESSIKRLLRILYQHYNQKPILLIDEYDTPLQEAYLKGYYEQLISFFRNLLSEPLKDSALLNRAILTGILRVSKESLFSGLSNIKIYSILHKKYSEYFGFTGQEIQELLQKAKLPTNLEHTKEWYNGYNFGDTTIYNPWSIIEFINDEGRLKSYWVNTSSNELVKNLIINSPVNIQDSMEKLIAGNTIKQYVDEHIVFNDLNTSSSAIWSLLLMSGYLKYIAYEEHGRRYLCELALPNNEVIDFYTSVVEEWITGDRGFNWYIEFLTNLTEGRIIRFEKDLQILIKETVSFYDANKKSQESFYHGLMLAFVSGLKKTHLISSNKESGEGLYDIAIIPKNKNKLGIIMEFKAIDNQAKLHIEAIDALQQIKKSAYATELRAQGITKICSIGIAFAGKAIKVVADATTFYSSAP